MIYKEKNLIHQIISEEFSIFKFDYLLLREPENWIDIGDFDLLVNNIDSASLHLKNLGYFEIFEHTIRNSRKFIKYLHSIKMWVHIDVHNTIDCKGIIWPKSFISGLLNRAKKGKDGIMRAPKEEASLLYLLHAASETNYIKSKYLHMIVNLDSFPGSFYTFLPKKLNHYSTLIQKFNKKEINKINLLDGFREEMKHREVSKISIFKRFLHRIKSFKEYKIIVFLGPDGSGKSSLVTKLSSVKWPLTEIEYMGPAQKKSMRNFLYLINQKLSKVRDKYKKTSIIGFTVRGACLFICYFDFLDRYYRNMWKFGSNKRIIFDRYACDMYFRKPNFINETLFLKFFPKPYLILLCVGDAQKIYDRKPEELSVKDIKNTIDLYRKKLNEYKLKYIEINTTTMNQDESLLFALKQIQLYKL